MNPGCLDPLGGISQRTGRIFSELEEPDCSRWTRKVGIFVSGRSLPIQPVRSSKYHPHGANQKVRTTKYWLAEPFFYMRYDQFMDTELLQESWETNCPTPWLTLSLFRLPSAYHHADWLLNFDPLPETSQLRFCPKSYREVTDAREHHCAEMDLVKLFTLD